MEAGLRTILVLTGISTRETAERFPYRPSLIVESVADLIESVESDQFLRTASER
jgi:NagD protein